MLLRILQWCFKRTAGIALIVTLGVAALATWLYLHDTLGFEERKAELIQSFNGERSRLLEAKSASGKRKQGYMDEQQLLRTRMATATRARHSLEELDSTWDRLFGDKEAQRSYAERREQLKQFEDKSKSRLEELDGLVRVENYTLEGLDLALGKLERRIEQAKTEQSLLMHYLRRAWEVSKWYLLATFAGWFLGPFIWRFVLYFVLSPLIAERRPLRLGGMATLLPEVSASSVALELLVPPGHKVRLKERFLQASDEALKRKTCWVLDWRMPFTSLACGLVELIELRSESGKSTQRITLSCADDPLAELALVRLKEGSSIILKPRYLAGILYPSQMKPRIRRHWVFNRWQAWLSFQFRYFEFAGPMDLVVSGSRGLRLENLSGREEPVARRVNRNAVIAFSADMEYRPVRAETFWSYYRGMNPLFDDLFSGQGLFLCQANAKQEAQAGERFWAAAWNGVLRIFGL